MALKSDAKFEEKLTCGLENNMRNLANFHQSTWKLKLKIGTFMGYFYPKQIMYELKIHRGVMTMKKDAKFEKVLTSSKLTWGIQQILTQALENPKNLHFNGLLFAKAYNTLA